MFINEISYSISRYMIISCITKSENSRVRGHIKPLVDFNAMLVTNS